MDLIDKTNKLNEAMKKFTDDISNHHSMLTNMSTTMVAAIEKLNEETKNIVLKNDELNAKKNTLNEENAALELKLKNLNNEREILEAQVKSSKEEIQQIQPEVEKIKSEINEMTSKVGEGKTKLANLEGVLQSKSAARETTETNVKAQIDAKQMELDTAKTESQDIIENNIIWDYLKSKIDNPEIDILAVIAGTRNISSDEIKKRASSISAVLITRSISKLEADGKIVSKDGKWDLSSPLLAELEK
jgi:chromosome segregation ATPase